ncbi:hypothetical protein [Tateyamaria pelophila]|uniref:hypothetical protein n=1 Tax=Tateyamaria pelophila TaxID=328415 RepID=UPI001CC01641|nr:hypothetical protein [Tateyamaria pelophila]
MAPKHTSAREQLARELIRHAQELALTTPGSGISTEIALAALIGAENNITLRRVADAMEKLSGTE